jgi:hypothetical protein
MIAQELALAHPETVRRRPKIARRLAARKLAYPQLQQAWRAQTEAGMLFNPLGGSAASSNPPWSCRAPPTRSLPPTTPRWPAPQRQCNASTERGHLLYWEQPRRFVHVVTDFLTDPASAARVPATAARRAS